MQPALLVLAAGMGSRYGSLKQIDGLGPCGETIIDYSIYDAIRAGFGKVVVVIRKSIEKDFQEVFFRKYSGKIDISYVLQEIDFVPQGISYDRERVKPWGTGHAVLMAADAIQEPFAVINGDDFYGQDAFVSMARYLSGIGDKASTEYSMVGYPVANTLSENGSVSRGICQVDSLQHLTDVVERTSIQRLRGSIVYKDEQGKNQPVAEDAVVSMNFWGFTPAFFPQLKALFLQFLLENGHQPKSEFYIPFAANQLIQSGEASFTVLNTHAEWFGVTYKEDRPLVVNKLQSLVDRKHYPSPLF